MTYKNSLEKIKKYVVKPFTYGPENSSLVRIVYRGVAGLGISAGLVLLITGIEEFRTLGIGLILGGGLIEYNSEHPLTSGSKTRPV